MISESTWSALEATAPSAAGWAKTRISQQTVQDLWLAVKFPEKQRALHYVIPVKDAPPSRHLPELRHMVVELVPHGEQRVEVHVRLEDSSLNDVFSVLVSDVSDHVARAESSEDGVDTLTARLRHWKNLLQPDSGHGLSREKRRGLYGELLFLRRLLELDADPVVVVMAWVGPAGAHQDFQASSVAVEVKTSASKKPQALRISSERQLDPTGSEHLLLAHISLDERPAGTGESLPAIVADLEDRLDGDLLHIFRQMLYAGGLLPSAMTHYEQPVYALRGLDYFEVRNGFPFIVESSCPEGIGDVSYSIQLSSIRDFSVPESTVLEFLGVPQ